MPDSLREIMRQAYHGVVDWPLWLSGSVGIGKTCACLVLADFSEQPMYYWTLGELREQLIDADHDRLWTNGENPVLVTKRSIFKKIAAANLVILDEVARGRVTEHHADTLKRVCDERHGRPLILISNTPIHEVGRVYDAAIASRCGAGNHVHITGTDMRQGSRIG